MIDISQYTKGSSTRAPASKTICLIDFVGVYIYIQQINSKSYLGSGRSSAYSIDTDNSSSFNLIMPSSSQCDWMRLLPRRFQSSVGGGLIELYLKSQATLPIDTPIDKPTPPSTLAAQPRYFGQTSSNLAGKDRGKRPTARLAYMSRTTTTSPSTTPLPG